MTEYKMKLEGWKAGVVLVAGIIILINAIATLPFMIALAIFR